MTSQWCSPDRTNPDSGLIKTREYRDQDQNKSLNIQEIYVYLKLQQNREIHDAGCSFTAAVTAVTLHLGWQPVLSYSVTDVSDQGQTRPSHSDKTLFVSPNGSCCLS